MDAQTLRGLTPTPAGEDEVRKLYQDLLDHWNKRSAPDLAGLFAEDGNLIGFDGSPINGRTAIESHLLGIFKDHETGAYVGKVREVRFLTPDVAILRAVAGMIPPGQSDLNPNVNAVQTLVAVKHEGYWRIEVYQNTPAAFHEWPELSQTLTEELRELL